MTTDTERCLQEIAQAQAAVMERCALGDYLWLQDWREELEHINESQNKGRIHLPNIQQPSDDVPHVRNNS